MSGLVTLTGTENGIVSSQHSIRSKLLWYDRTTASMSGNGDYWSQNAVSLTGAGFAPTACVGVGSNQYFGFGGGWAAEQEDGTLIQATSTVYYSTSDLGRNDSDHMYRQSAGSGETWYCRMAEFEPDGGKVEYRMDGSPSSSLLLAIMWLR